ncbi:MAG: CDP-alcohol phosphatidyltransferase family protein [Actinomycetota bacterium]|nr:CDP-alcohol phosphatidyltransferase family protein [Actinomycetota bacterium]
MLRRRHDEDRVLTLPNAVTAVRLALIPVFVVLLAQPHKAHWQAAAWLLAGIGATDFVDGQLARRLHQVTTLGKVLDPIADRLLLTVGSIAIIAVGAVPTWVVVVALAREVVVAGGFMIVAAIGGRRMDVSRAGKAATLALMVALPLFLVGHAGVSWSRGAENVAWVFAIPGLILGWYSAISYFPMARRSLASASAPARDAREPDVRERA